MIYKGCVVGLLYQNGNSHHHFLPQSHCYSIYINSSLNSASNKLSSSQHCGYIQVDSCIVFIDIICIASVVLQGVCVVLLSWQLFLKINVVSTIVIIVIILKQWFFLHVRCTKRYLYLICILCKCTCLDNKILSSY